jgi:hypothetical protein
MERQAGSASAWSIIRGLSPEEDGKRTGRSSARRSGSKGREDITSLARLRLKHALLLRLYVSQPSKNICKVPGYYY